MWATAHEILHEQRKPTMGLIIMWNYLNKIPFSGCNCFNQEQWKDRVEFNQCSLSLSLSKLKGVDYLLMGQLSFSLFFSAAKKGLVIFAILAEENVKDAHGKIDKSSKISSKFAPRIKG